MKKEAITKLNTEAMRDVYKSQGGLTDAQFDALFVGTAKINALDLGEFHWHIPYLARDVHTEISWAVHLQAWAAGLGFPYEGIEDFYKRAIDAGLFPIWFLNQTTFHEPSGGIPKLPIGRLLVRLGLISATDLQRALGIQVLIREEAGLPARVGRILSTITPVSLPDVTKAMCMHLGVPYVSLEETVLVVERGAVKPR